MPENNRLEYNKELTDNLGKGVVAFLNYAGGGVIFRCIDKNGITSYGGFPEGLTYEEFFNGRSMSRNKEIMRIFKDLELVEQLGTGIPRILEFYDQDCFHFSEKNRKQPMKRIKIFISSVQSKFAEERQMLYDYIRQDALLGQFFEPFIFDFLPVRAYISIEKTIQ